MKSSPETITLRRETVEGFVDRGGNFRTDGAKTERADRWVSDYFNLRRRADDPDVARESDVKDG